MFLYFFFFLQPPSLRQLPRSLADPTRREQLTPRGASKKCLWPRRARPLRKRSKNGSRSAPSYFQRQRRRNKAARTALKTDASEGKPSEMEDVEMKPFTNELVVSSFIQVIFHRVISIMLTRVCKRISMNGVALLGHNRRRCLRKMSLPESSTSYLRRTRCKGHNQHDIPLYSCLHLPRHLNVFRPYRCHPCHHSSTFEMLLRNFIENSLSKGY